MIHSTYFFGFIQQYLSHSIVNNSVTFLLSVEFTPWYRVDPTVLSRLAFSILSHKFTQDLTFIGRMSGAVDEAVFNWLFKLSTYPLEILPELSSIEGRVFDEADTTVSSIPVPVQWLLSQQFFNNKVLPHLNKYFLRFTYAQTCLHIFKIIQTRNQSPEHILAYNRCQACR